ncbi:kinesin-domain-containing protein [Jaminaea rosea]|uniref:Kinesin-domain-containing protein n=1 Tax=Jaminaea rosea TaxID=1569628 RepID=A0A316UVJ2_9BASI|nr:kinesin-domain-containing protein [Jaminaea rosea]PWN27933.1 kinesin-domain-containing protein [Jaminaea rosea]
MAKAKAKAKVKSAPSSPAKTTAAKMVTKATPLRVSPSMIEADESAVADESIANTTRNDDDEENDGMATPTGNDTLLGLDDDDDDDEEAGPSAAASNVVVCVRVRPAPAAASSSDGDSWKLTDSTSTIEATPDHPSIAKRGGSSSAPGVAPSASSSFISEAAPPKSSDKDTYKFTFDSILPPSTSSLESLYTGHISPVVKGAVQGYNGTVFAYGQTGSGKTFTMSGGGGDKGVIGRAIDEVFDCVGKEADREFLLRVSYLEIYNESLRDLLVGLPSSASMASVSATTATNRPASPTKGGYAHRADGGTTLRIQEHPSSGRVTIAGLREELVTSPADILSLLERGQAARHQAATDWNERSSRSHCVATVTIESRSKEGGDGVRVSALNLIDLAGSERAATEKERRKEGAFINKSLLTLGSVISKLSASAANPAAAAHIPYRDSKLTRLLQTSLSGNARVAVLLTMSPLAQHAVEGLSTLKFGRRCKMIKLHAKKGEIGEGDGASEALLRRYKREVEKLRARLEEPAAIPRSSSGGSDDSSLRDVEARRRAAEEEVVDMTRQKSELRAQMEHLTKLILTGKSVGDNAGKTMPPSTPPRPRGRVSEFGTPGTPSRPSSPHKRMCAASKLQRSTSDSLEEEPSVSSSSRPKPFALEAELASLRRNLAQALESKARSEEALEKEVEAWQARVAEVKTTLQEREKHFEAAESERKAAEEKLRAEVERLGREGQEAVDAGKGRDAEMEELRTELRMLKEELRESSNRLATAIADLSTERRKGGEELASQQASHDAELKKLQTQRRALEEDLGSRTTRLASTAAELEEERRKLSEAELKLSKRPESDEEVVQNEFDELVREARAKEQAGLKSPNMAAGKKLSPDGDREGRLKEREERAKQREAEAEARAEEMDRLQRDLAKREKLIKDREAAPMPAPPSCDHAARIATLEQQLREARVTVPSSPSRLREALATTPTKAASSVPFSLQRGGSLREYRRYTRPGLPSPPSSSANATLPALALASPSNATSSTSSSAAASSDPLLEAALRNEREEVARLNSVIQAQRNMMGDLEASVAQWQAKMGEQQEIIRMLMEENNAVATGKELPTPPMGEADLENKTPAQLAIKSKATRGLRGSTPLHSSSGRASNGATPPRHSAASASQQAPASLPRSAAMKNDDFLKRRSAFLVDSPSQSKDAKPRAGSMMPIGSAPYYGAHTFNRPPGSSSSNAGLGLTAPSSPTKGSGLWGNVQPDPLPVPEGSMNTTPRKQRPRVTIEHELERLKSGASPRVDERTRELLESPKRAHGASRFAGQEGERASRDWYI